MGSGTLLRNPALLAAVVALSVAGEAGAGYTIVDLGAMTPGSSAIGNAINNSGAVAGTITAGNNTTTAQQTSGSGTFADVPLAPIYYAGSSTAGGINNAGQVTGSFYDFQDRTTHAYLTSGPDGTATDLKTLDYHPTPTTTVKSVAVTGTGINDNGAIVGTDRLIDGTSRAITGNASGLAFVPSIGDGQYSQGSGINAGGQVVGYYEQNPGVYHAFYTDTHGNPVDILTSYTMPGFGLNSYGTAINAAGAVVGYGDYGQGYSHAFLAPAPGASPGQPRTPVVDLGTLSGFTSSFAYGVNSSSQVVGKLDAQGSNPTAFLYDPTLGMVSLYSLLSPADRMTWSGLTTATAINDVAQITGQGLIGGQLHAFELTPVPGQPLFTPATSAVPEPPALALSAFGLAIVAAWARVRRGRSSGRAAA